MRLYLAALYSNSFYKGSKVYETLTPREQAARDSAAAILESYYYVGQQKHVDIMRACGKKIFLDSGAFSALSKKITISIDDYCAYIQRNADIIEVASVLDGIGDAQLTYENQLYMESKGVNVLPCFHQGEDPRYLEYYIGKYDHITLGGMVGATTQKLIQWLDTVWEKHLTDSTGHARLKVHGFGITSPAIMTRYPWYSVDSSSWVHTASFGGIFIPELGKSVAISDNNPALKMLDQHYDSLDPINQKEITNYLHWLGFDPQRLREDFRPRWAYNCYAYQRLGELCVKAEDFVFKRQQLGIF